MIILSYIRYFVKYERKNMFTAVIIVVVLVVYCVSMYNKLVLLRQQVKEAWATVDTFLKRRYDLVPNLVEVVKGYAQHEKETLDAVINARNVAMNATDTAERAKDENVLSGTLKSLFALSEAYPDLKANTNFLELQQELADTENKIQASRQFYNTTVMSLNTRIEMFPSNLIAKHFHFQSAEYFELDDAEKLAVMQTPKISF